MSARVASKAACTHWRDRSPAIPWSPCGISRRTGESGWPGRNTIPHQIGSTPEPRGAHQPALREEFVPAIETMWSGETRVIEDRNRIEAVGHRVVHGGEKLRESTLITPEWQRRSTGSPSSLRRIIPSSRAFSKRWNGSSVAASLKWRYLTPLFIPRFRPRPTPTADPTNGWTRASAATDPAIADTTSRHLL